MSTTMDAGLDALGTADPTGLVDGYHALTYVARGEWGNAGLTAVGVFPILGDAFKLAKYGRAVGGVEDVYARFGPELLHQSDAVAHYGDDLFGQVDTATVRMSGSLNVSAPRTALRSSDDFYGGIRQASKYLQEMGISRGRRLEILQAFEEGTVNLRQAGTSEFGIRYFSDPAHAGGSWLFETFPASRESLALRPRWNSMTGFRQFQINPGTPVIQGRAAAQGPYLPGGQTQKFILDWKSGLIEP